MALEALRKKAKNGNLSDVTISEDGKTLKFLDGDDCDATLKCAVPGTPDETAYSLGALYLLCLHPNSLIGRKRASSKFKVEDNVKVTHQEKILTYFGLVESEATADKEVSDTAPGTAIATTGDNNLDKNSKSLSEDQDVGQDDMDMSDVEMEISNTEEKSKTEEKQKDDDDEQRDDKQNEKKVNESKTNSVPSNNNKSTSHLIHTKRREEDERRKKHGHHSSSSRKDRDRYHHHRHKKDDKYGKKDKTPFTNEQVMQNLSFLHGKRGQPEQKRKSTDFPPMNTKNSNIHNDINNTNNSKALADSSAESSMNKGDPSLLTNQDDTNKDNQDQSDTQTMDKTQDASSNNTKTSHVITETEEEKKNRERNEIFEALSSKEFNFSPEVIAADQEATEKIVSMETPVGDSVSVLRFASRDFSRVLGLYMEVKKNEERAAAHAQQSGSKSKRHKRDHQSSSSNARSGTSSWENSSSKYNKSSSNSMPKKKVGLPLIIVPNAMTSPLSMINAKEFFAEAKFIPRDRVNKQRKKASSITFKRRMSSRLMSLAGPSIVGSGEIEYEIMDNPGMRLKKSEWDRVVAVVAHGEKWQFKNWKWNEPVEIFSNCFGFYVGMEGAPIPKGLIGWNVRKAYLNRDKRGLDCVTHATFWNRLVFH